MYKVNVDDTAVVDPAVNTICAVDDAVVMEAGSVIETEFEPTVGVEIVVIVVKVPLDEARYETVTAETVPP